MTGRTQGESGDQSGHGNDLSGAPTKTTKVCCMRVGGGLGGGGRMCVCVCGGGGGRGVVGPRTIVGV